MSKPSKPCGVLSVSPSERTYFERHGRSHCIARKLSYWGRRVDAGDSDTGRAVRSTTCLGLFLSAVACSRARGADRNGRRVEVARPGEDTSSLAWSRVIWVVYLLAWAISRVLRHSSLQGRGPKGEATHAVSSKSEILPTSRVEVRVQPGRRQV